MNAWDRIDNFLFRVMSGILGLIAIFLLLVIAVGAFILLDELS